MVTYGSLKQRIRSLQSAPRFMTNFINGIYLVNVLNFTFLLAIRKVCKKQVERKHCTNAM